MENFGNSEITNPKKDNEAPEVTFTTGSIKKIDEYESHKIKLITKEEISSYLSQLKAEINDKDKNGNGTNIDEILSSMKEKGKVIYDDFYHFKEAIYLNDFIGNINEADEKIKFSVFYLGNKINEEINNEGYISYEEFIKIFEDNLDSMGVLKNWKELINNDPKFTWQTVGVPLYNKLEYKIDGDKNGNGTNIDEILSSIKKDGYVKYEDIFALEKETIDTIDSKYVYDEKGEKKLDLNYIKIKFSFFYLRNKLNEKINNEGSISYKEFIKIFEDNLDSMGVLKDWRELIASPKPDWINNKKEVYKTDEIIKSKK